MRSDFRFRRLSEIPRNSASRMSASSIDTNPRMIAKMLCNAQSGSISGIVQSSTISVTLPKQSMLRNLAYPLCLKGKHCIARSFSVFSDVFDLTQNPSHWPNPLKSHSCNLVTASDVLRPVSVSGWVDSIRVMKDSVFIVLRDGCGRVQTLFPCDKDGCPPKRLSRLVEDVLKDIPLESVVCVTGTVWMGVISESRCKSAPKMPLIPTCRRAVLKSRGITSIS